LMWWLCVQSPVYYRLYSVYTVSTVFHHVINLQNSSSEAAAMVWGAVCKNIISDRFSTKTAISGRDSYLCMQRYYLWQR